MRCSFAEFSATRCSANVSFPPFQRYYFLLCLSKAFLSFHVSPSNKMHLSHKTKQMAGSASLFPKKRLPQAAATFS